MKKITFTYNGNEKRISKAVSERLACSFSYVQKLIRSRDVRLNGVKAVSDALVVSGDEITVFYSDTGLKTVSPIYEDQNAAIFVKPVHMPSEGEGSLMSLLPENYILCHRLDTNTEGLIIVSKTEDFFRAVKTEISSGNILKYYTAVVCGQINNSGSIKGYLVKDSEKGKVYIDKAGKEADKIVTPYEIIKNYEEKTVVKVLLLHGKTHQIRASFASIGHPVIGDSKYGTNEINRKFKAKTQWLCATEIKFAFSSESPYFYLNKLTFKIKPKTFDI